MHGWFWDVEMTDVGKCTWALREVSVGVVTGSKAKKLPANRNSQRRKKLQRLRRKPPFYLVFKLVDLMLGF